MPPPPTEVLNKWKQQIQQWINTINHLNISSAFPQRAQSPDSQRIQVTRLNDRFESFWSLVLTGHGRSTSHADFNAFFMSQIINNIWRYNTLFSRFSECQQIFTKEFAFLCQQHRQYHRALAQVQDPPQSIEKNRAASLANSGIRESITTPIITPVVL